MLRIRKEYERCPVDKMLEKYYVIERHTKFLWWEWWGFMYRSKVLKNAVKFAADEQRFTNEELVIDL